jgi:HlyD family secretion protein
MITVDGEAPLTGETITPLRQKNILIIAGLLLFIVAAVYFNLHRGSREPALPVQVVSVEEKDLVKTIFATGRLEAAGRQEIYAESSGLLAEVKVKAGEFVKVGQVLAKMDTVPLAGRLEGAQANLSAEQAVLGKLLSGPQPEVLAQEKAALAQAEAELEGTRQKLERTRLLYNQGVATKVELEEAERELKIRLAGFDQAAARLQQLEKGTPVEELQAARARVMAAQAAVKNAREQLDKAVFRTGRDGFVLVCDCRTGSYITAGELLVVIGDPENLEITAEISESDSGELAPGQEATFTCPAMPEKEFKGIVTWTALAAVGSGVGGTVDSSGADGGSPKVTVRIKPSGPSTGLRPGYTADMTITTRISWQAAAIPHEAVLEEGCRQWTYVVQNGLATRREIKTGISNELFVEITKGVQKGEKVIINPPEKLKDGQTVKEKEVEKEFKK